VLMVKVSFMGLKLLYEACGALYRYCSILVWGLDGKF